MAKSEAELEKSEKAAQSYAALGVGFVCIVIGLPLWWKTTEVYRVQLPYNQIESLNASQLTYRAHFSVVVSEPSWNDATMSSLGIKLKTLFENLESTGSITAKYRGNIRHAYEEERNIMDKATSVSGMDAALSLLSGWQEVGKYYIVVLPAKQKVEGLGQGNIGKHRIAYIQATDVAEDCIQMVEHVLRDLVVEEPAMLRIVSSAVGAAYMKADKERMRSVHFHPGYELTFTLLNPQPDILNVQWDIRGGIQKYLRPFTSAFSDLVDIRTKSQYLHYAGLSVRPMRDSSGNFSVLRQDELPHIINPIEGSLASHVTNNPALNFIVYVPSRDQSPLYFVDEAGQPASNNAFLSPRWGGMQVYNIQNPPDGSPRPYDVNINMKPVMETSLSQLRLLLGINTQASAHGVHLLQPGSKGFADWELDKWMRARALENVASATTTLQSLVQLLEEVGNIVINDDIGSEVNRAVSSITKAHQYLSAGKLKDAFLASRQAIMSSEKAFFDPSLLELLYFPEDQKFAIYIPLFLPISIPIVLSLIQAIKWISKKNQPSAQGDDSQSTAGDHPKKD